MKIRIDDDYDYNDLENFNISSENIATNINESIELGSANIIDASFTEVEVEKKSSKSVDNYKQYYNENFYNKKKESNNDAIGKINVVSRLANNNKTLISSAKINLYILNGVSPKLIETKYTDTEGKVVFENLKKGSYRIIAIVDRKYFEKPSYSPWNEVTIDSNNSETSILVTNKIKVNK